ncbi:hypothetical protein ATY41_10700 [Leifsonia xyli subsp. xyli]|uniref:Structural phage protein n=2 Tax=Leifsonia xyli subsp. xyli TaxID=59736 RepID=Q6AGV4_LEIXX|nr:hypothetical protein [Leifsonia xyli]AAT88391.1 structural phage protein [Leifsonia xyli subsp. xyli str. CTCB07]ODA90222.1 hypothetical protein ATY41_10700 [Leifsonia xyli subsp. xyli]
MVRAPLGTTGPTSASAALPASWNNLGYISKDGSTRTTDRSTNDIKAWQNSALMRTVVTEASVSYKFVMLESRRATVALYFGTTVGGDGTFDVKPANTSGRQSFVFDIIDGTDIRRVWIPEGEVVEVGDLTFDARDPTGYEVTIKAYASSIINGGVERVFNPGLNDNSAAAPGMVFASDANITASDSANAAKLAGLGYAANPTSAWTTGQKITIGTYDFNWSGTGWAAGTHA